VSPMNANVSPVALNKSGVERFVKTRGRNLISGVMDAMEDELSGRSDLKIKTSVKATASLVTGELSVSSDKTYILSEELGTENQSPRETVGRLVKDPSVRTRIVRRAAGKL